MRSSPTTLLPPGLLGLVLAGFFSHTMAMTSSDANAISSVVVRDIIPALRRGRGHLAGATELLAGRISTFLFIGLSMVIALTADSFGGVLGLIIAWFGALVGPVAIPMLLGMLPWFKRCGPSAALWSWTVGLIVFAVTKYVIPGQIASLGTANAQTISVISPIVASIVVFVVVGLVRPWHSTESDELVDSLSHDQPERVDDASAAAGGARVTADTRTRVGEELEQRVLPWWQEHGVDHEYGGVLTGFDNAGRRLTTDKYTWSQGRWAWLCARIATDARAGLLRQDPQEWAGYARSTAEFVARHSVLPGDVTAHLVTRSGEPMPGGRARRGLGQRAHRPLRRPRPGRRLRPARPRPGHGA